MKEKWYQKSYRRNFLDFHIPDWNEKFLSKFDIEKFMDTVELSNGTSITFFANAHTGLCHYPTKVGKMHELLKGRDLLKEEIDAAHKRGYDVIIYYCTIYTDWYWDTHPNCRIVDAEGKSEKLLMNSKGIPRRFSVCCPNNPGYREFVRAQLEEICTGYDFEGVWPDMTFWPTVCYCASCRERYEREVGGEIPRVINWEDPVWVGFQRKREEWLVDFVKLVNETIRKYKPEVTIAHQSNTYSDDWLFGPSVELSKHTDWLSADLYRDRYEMPFLGKLFYSLSEKKPYEQVNCWYYPNIHEHVVARTQDHLMCTTFMAFMNNGAQVFIDAIDPIGTVNRNNYIRAGKVYKELKKYEKFAGGRFCQDIGVYLSFESLFDMAENGKDVSTARYNFEPGRRKLSPSAHNNAVLNMTKSILQNHLPFGAVTRKNLKELFNYQIIVLPNVVMLDDEEIKALKEYVGAGGSIYASKYTSIISMDGHRQGNFLLSELFGVSYLGETQEITTYVKPCSSMKDSLAPFSDEYPVTLHEPQVKVKLNGNAKILATVTLPYTDPKGTRYASILTDPPGIDTDYPAIVLNEYGKGKVIYTSGALEIWEHETQRAIVGNLLRMLASKPFCFEVENAPTPVEITLFDQEDKKRFIINILNFQRDLPNIPVEGIRLKIRMDGRKPEKLAVLPDGKEIHFETKDGIAEFIVPRLETFLMLELNYE